MLIVAHTRPEELRAGNVEHFANERWVIGWKGHLYLPGSLAGQPSIARLAARLSREPLTTAVKDLRGVYGLFVHDREKGCWQITVDNTGLYKIFFDQGGAGTSLLEMMEHRSYGRAELSPQTMAGFLAHGITAPSDTFLEDVSKLGYDQVLKLRPGAKPRLLSKQLAYPETDNGDTVLQEFADLALSLTKRRLSVDVTGGFDSRLIACCLAHHGADFEIATAGQHKAIDIEIAGQIAKILGRPFYPYHHRINRLEEELPTAFDASDGQHEMRGFHRDWQHAWVRRARGVDVIAHGGGGETFSDFNSFQDFPLYGRRRFNLRRFYQLRIAPTRMPPELLGPQGMELASAARQQLMACCERLAGSTNCETYDRVYVRVRMAEFMGRYYTNYINMGLDVVAPYLDARASQIAANMSPWSRWMHGWHRTVISRYNPAVAALPTTEGCTARTGLRSFPEIGWTFVREGSRRVVRKLGQRLVGRPLWEKRGLAEFHAHGYTSMLRGTSQFPRACRDLAELGILAPDCSPGLVPDFFVPRVLTLGMFIEQATLASKQDATAGMRAA